MPKLSVLTAETATVSIPVGGDESLTVVFRKSFMSPTLAARLESVEGSGMAGQMGAFAELVARSVVSWNLLNDDGTPIPLTFEALAEVPADVLMRVIVAMREAFAPDPLKDGSSKPGSSPAGSSAAALTGTA